MSSMLVRAGLSPITFCVFFLFLRFTAASCRDAGVRRWLSLSPFRSVGLGLVDSLLNRSLLGVAPFSPASRRRYRHHPAVSATFFAAAADPRRPRRDDVSGTSARTAAAPTAGASSAFSGLSALSGLSTTFLAAAFCGRLRAAAFLVAVSAAPSSPGPSWPPSSPGPIQRIRRRCRQCGVVVGHASSTRQHSGGRVCLTPPSR